MPLSALMIGAALWLIGVPSAPLWGMLAMIMRFVPYIGAFISAIFPLVLAAAIGPGWTMVLMTAALFLIAEVTVGQAIEPLLYGQSTGLSPVAVITSATFWTWLWGPIGLILATPLTMCLVVLGRHVDQLKFLEVMFGDEPPLTPAELIYQRMLARDPVEAADQARVFLKEKSLAAYYDEILLEGLRLAQADAQRGLLDEDRMNRIRDAVAEIVDDLATHTDAIKLKIGPGATKGRCLVVVFSVCLGMLVVGGFSVDVHVACDDRISLYPAAPFLATLLHAWTTAQVGRGSSLKRQTGWA